MKAQKAEYRNHVTFQEFELLEKVCAYKGVTKVQEKTTKKQAFTVDVNRMWS